MIVEDKNGEELNVLYKAGALLNYIADIKARLKSAIDEENTLFKIRMTVVSKGDKVESRTLEAISEHKA